MISDDVFGLSYNAFGGYWEGDHAAHEEALGEAAMRYEERQLDAMERIARLYAEMAKEFRDEGKTRRWHSLMRRAESERTWWHPDADDSDRSRFAGWSRRVPA